MIAPALNLERQADALARAQKHWRDVQGFDSVYPVQTTWTIALTREAGTNAAAVAQEIGTRLHWPVYDRELVERIAREMGLRSTLLDSVDEKQKSWLIECVESMTAAGPISEARYVKHLVETLLSLSTHGQCVIVGRGSAHLLPPNRTLRVRLVGDRHDRVQNAQRHQSLTEAEAVHWVDQTDQERVQFVKDHFGKDATDPAAYDLVLNVARWSNTDCVDFIVQALKKLGNRN
jgi:cytidylate kinase